MNHAAGETDDPVAWYFYAATVLFGRSETQAWRMTPRTIWALYREHQNEQAATARLWLAQLEPPAGQTPRLPQMPKL